MRGIPSRPTSLSPLIGALALLGTALATSCGPPQDPADPGPPATAEAAAKTAPKPAEKPPEQPSDTEPAGPKLANVGVSLPDDSICEKNDDGTLTNPIEEGRYAGILQNAKCEQQKFITMGRVAQALGVACSHCHAPHPTDPKKEDYPKMTEKKHIANWMSSTFIQGLKRVDGTAMMCANCHSDEKNKKPTAKFLGEPRNSDYAQEWMGEVMTTKFVELSGKRLKCKTCHVGMAPGREGWTRNVLEQLKYTGDGVMRKK